MGTGIHLWSQTADSNSNADSSINWAEGQSPGSVNNSARAMMARVADWLKDLGGITTTGTGTAYVVATNRAFGSAAVMDGSTIYIRPNADSGAAPSLAVDGLTARAINISTGVTIHTGALKTGTTYALVYVHASTEFILLGAMSSLGAIIGTTGTFTDTVTVTGATSIFVPYEGISTDAGASAGPLLSLYRNSASPAASDFIGELSFYGNDSGGNKTLYAYIVPQITDPANGSEDADVYVNTLIGGVDTTILRSSGAQIQVPGTLAVTGAASAGSLSVNSVAVTGKAPTFQYLTSGSAATYSTPAGCKLIRAHIKGSGGGGCRSQGGPFNGSAGGDTTFNSVVAKGGSGGTSLVGGAGGTGGAGSATQRFPGSAGNHGGNNGGGYDFGGNGAPGLWGNGAGAAGDNSGGTATAGAANTGGGGGGDDGGAGGGSGEHAILEIPSPGASYTYTITAGGAAGSTAGAGGSGIIIVEEYY